VIDAGFWFPFDIGIGLATFLNSNEVADVSAELEKITDEEFVSQFNPALMKQLKNIQAGNFI
jgi:hypothetical protein